MVDMPPETNPRRRRSGLPLIIGAVVILLAAGGYYAWSAMSEAEEPIQEPIVETPVAQQDAQYASSTMKFSLMYPPTFMLEEPYLYTRVSASKPISGVKFKVPSTMVQGTNLAADSGVSVEQLPRAKACTGDIFVKANVRAMTQTSGSLTFSVATSSETVGGDTYEEMVYAVASSSPCVAVRYFIHSTAAGTSTSSFDRSALLAAFDKIRASLSVQ